MTSSSPLPPIPIELKREILRFCDPSTLAKTSLVSLAFLEMSSPLLYDEVEITGFRGFERLFCDRNPLLHEPQVEPYLSLPQIRNLTVTFNEDVSEVEPTFHTTRFLPSPALPLETLSLGLGDDDDSFSDVTWTAILCIFDPNSVVIFRHSSCQGRFAPLVSLVKASWPSLRTLAFDSCISTSPLSRSSFLCGPLEKGRGISVCFDLTKGEEYGGLEGDAVGELLGFDDESPLLDLLGVREVILRISSISQRERIEAEVFNEVDEATVEAWKSRLRFEVVE